MKNTTKNIIRIIAFLLVLTLFTARIISVISWKESTAILKFYEYEKDQADVIFYGASRTACAVNPSTMWDRYGIAAIDLAEAGQNLGSTYYYMEESLKRQHPKVMMVDLSLLEQIDDGHDGNMYINTINMHYSPIYVKNAVYEWSHSVFSDSKNMLKWLLAKFPVYHTRYREITYRDYVPVTNEEPAFYNTFASAPYDIPPGYGETGRHELSPEVTDILDKMMNLAEANGCALTFYIPPYCVYPEPMQGYNAAADYVGARGYQLINFCTFFDQIGFDYATDMQNEGLLGNHVNIYGSEKVTDYLTEYLHTNYDLPDRRGDAHYDVYNKISANWQATRCAYAMSEIDDLASKLAMTDPAFFDYAIYISGDNVEQWKNYISNANPNLMQSDVSDRLYISVPCDKDCRFRMGQNVTVQTNESPGIYTGDSSKTANGQEMEIILLRKTGNVFMHLGYSLDEGGNPYIVWWEDYDLK